MTNIHCGGDWLLAYADNELTGEDARQAADHVAGCTRCQQEVAALRTSLVDVQNHWHAPLPNVVSPPALRPLWAGRASVLLRAAIVAAIALTLVWRLTASRDSTVAVAPTTNSAPDQSLTKIDLDTETAIDEWLQRETQIARLRAASELLVHEPGMQERGEQLEQYLSRTYLSRTYGN